MIGVVTTSYPRGPDDGAGGFVRQRVRELRQGGHSVEILAAAHPGCIAEEGVTRLESWGLFYTGGAPEALEQARGPSRLWAWAKAAGFSVSMLRQLWQRRGLWQGVESHWLLPCGVLAAAALPGLPHRCHVHGGDVYLLRRLALGDSLARNLCRGGTRLVFASANLRDRFSDLVGQAPEDFGARCEVRPAPFDASLFRPRLPAERVRLRAEFGFAGPTVLAAGRLVPIKGFDLLIAALAAIPGRDRPDLVLAGSGPESMRLRRQAREAQVRLRLTGSLGQSALARAMAAADLFVHPCRTLSDGRSEGMPLVVREALACGARVVACASGGLCELDGTDRLCLVPGEDAVGLGVAIRSALELGR